jgi:fatty acid desaturase
MQTVPQLEPLTIEDTRASWLETFPAFSQRFLTWLSAKPHAGQQPSTHSAVWYLATCIVTIALGLSLFALDAWPVRVLAIAITTSALRRLQVVAFHHCSHGTVFRSRLANAVLGESISAVVLIKSFAAYRRDHIRHHNSKHLLTADDETVQFLVAFAGLEPGLTRRELWRRLLLNFVTPLFHLRWLGDRVISCFFSEGGRWRIARFF